MGRTNVLLDTKSQFEQFVKNPIGLKPVHPTAQKLIDATLRALEMMPVEKIGIEKILDDTKAARSSLYHHFESFPHLLECAVAYRFAEETKKTIEQLETVVTVATTADDFRKSALAINATLQAAGRTSIRMQRIVAFAATDKNTRFLELMKLAQQNLTNAYAKILKDAKEKSWIRADVDPYAVAVFVQAMTIGRIIDDVSQEQVKPENWTNVTEQALIALLW